MGIVEAKHSKLDWKKDLKTKARREIYEEIMKYDFWGLGREKEEKPAFTFEQRLQR